MKLSEAIELAIMSGKYSYVDGYMCCVLRRMNMEYHVGAIQKMMSGISSKGYPSQPLICTLHDAKVLDMEDMSPREQFNYTLQFYCWWVFDLKRKGL